jgi:hypothetical protein
MQEHPKTLKPDEVTVEFEWTNPAKIELGPDDKLFPNLPLDPGLYRFWLGGAEHSAVYKGEAESAQTRRALSKPGAQSAHQHQA